MARGSRFRTVFFSCAVLAGYGGCAGDAAGTPGPAAVAPATPAPSSPGPGAAPAPPLAVDGDGAAAASRDPAAGHGEACLGVDDRGIWSDLDPQVQLGLPTGQVLIGQVDPGRKLLLAWAGDRPAKPYPLVPAVAGAVAVEGAPGLAVRPGDAAEVARLSRTEPRPTPATTRWADRDDDGLPDPLDILVGARKTVLNADAYGAGYIKLAFPLGDVPRTVGVCTDVVIRALRNAGLDLQAEVQRDIDRARASYPMVKGGGDPNIDHRRVKTILPYFKRHWQAHAVAFVDDQADPWWPGDVVFMDTFPSRSGPDHIGIVSDRRGPSGHYLIINNWTDGTVTAEMDLLAFVPITHRFRVPPAR